MAQPTAYERQASFSNIQAQSPDDPLPGATLDAELNAVKETLDGILANLELIQRDDGDLANESVGLDQLAEEIEVGWNAPEVWVTATEYSEGSDTVFHGSAFYRCLVDHTAGTFSTDLAAGKWEQIVDLSSLTIVAASQIANTPSGSISSTTVQDAINELALEKAASSHTHPSSAITDSTAAGRNMLTAADVAAQQALLGLGSLAYLNSVPVTAINAQLALTGIIEPAALSSSQNDWAPTSIATSSTIRMSASSTGVALTGLLAPARDGEIKVLENVGSYAITLSANSASSAAANRFLLQKPIIVGPNTSVVLKYDLDGTTPGWRLFDRSAHLPRGYIDGLITSNAADTTNDITIAAGECRGARGILDLVLTSALTKQLDADWTAGNNAGGRYVSSANNPAIADTTYHLHLIGKIDGTVDAMFYTGVDPTAVLPAGYVDYRHIWSIVRSGGTILNYSQNGDECLLNTPVRDYNNSGAGTSAVTVTLASCPTGLKVRANITAYPASGVYVRVSALTQTDQAPAQTVSPFFNAGSDIGGSGVSGQASGTLNVWTNTSAQIRTRMSSNAQLYVQTNGWMHPRGRDG